MEKIWLKSYPPGVPAEVDTTVYASLPALFEDSFKKYANDKAYVCMDKAITFGDMQAGTMKFEHKVDISRIVGILCIRAGVVDVDERYGDLGLIAGGIGGHKHLLVWLAIRTPCNRYAARLSGPLGT